MKPTILVVDDNEKSLEILQRDMTRRYGAHYLVRSASSPSEAVRKQQRWARDKRTVALVIAYQWMPEMTGIDLLSQSREHSPGAMRALMIDVGDLRAEEPIIRALTLNHIDYYFGKPWASPEEELYPTTGEALRVWSGTHLPRMEKIKFIGDLTSPLIRSLVRGCELNNVVSGAYAPDSPAGTAIMREHDLQQDDLPAAILYDGRAIRDLSTMKVARAMGGRDLPAQHALYDVTIVGAGPAGLAAAVNAAAEGLRVLVLESFAVGGQAGTSAMIRNYLGFPWGISGRDLAERASRQAQQFGAYIAFTVPVAELGREDGKNTVLLADGRAVHSRTVTIATGVSYRQLEAPGVDRLVGNGVFYGAGISEARALGAVNVCVVGAGNSAGQLAIFLSQVGATVTLLVRGPSLTRSLSDYLVKEIEANERVHVLLHSQVAEAVGEHSLEAVTVLDHSTQRTREVASDALFVMIGAEPHTDWLEPSVARDNHGFVLTGADLLADENSRERWPLSRPPLLLETSTPGVFAAGDVRHGSIKRVAGAVGEGAASILLISQYLRESDF
ncbi:MAG: FAD-dependent oxidoreductase [Actinomycetota bacterium]|nr:FAD-dependent oxidoreductase [Actinomycetota bacterium]